MALSVSITAEPLFEVAHHAITNSIFTSALVTIFLLYMIIKFANKKLDLTPKAYSLQNILEIIFEGFLNLYKSVLGEKKAKKYFPILTTIFLYILFSNWTELLPGLGSIGINTIHHGEKIFVPILRAPTADLNTTVALAIVAFVFIQYNGIKELGADYFKKFFINPIKKPIYTFVGFLELVGEFTKIISFAFRLFGNIFAGEVLLAVMTFLFPLFTTIPFLGMELFVGVIQAFVFMMLMLVFVAGAIEPHHS